MQLTRTIADHKKKSLLTSNSDLYLNLYLFLVGGVTVAYTWCDHFMLHVHTTLMSQCNHCLKNNFMYRAYTV